MRNHIVEPLLKSHLEHLRGQDVSDIVHYVVEFNWDVSMCEKGLS